MIEMSSLNKVFIIGNLGAEPENKTLESGFKVTRISIATKRVWKDKQGKNQDHTEWHSVSLFDRLSEIAAQYLKKGSKVFIEGYIKTSKWKDQQGVTRYKTEIVGTQMQLMDSKYDADKADSDDRQSITPFTASRTTEDDELPF